MVLNDHRPSWTFKIKWSKNGVKSSKSDLANAVSGIRLRTRLRINS